MCCDERYQPLMNVEPNATVIIARRAGFTIPGIQCMVYHRMCVCLPRSLDGEDIKLVLP